MPGISQHPPFLVFSGRHRTVAEMLRVIVSARPQWFLMENVRQVPDVVVEGYTVQRLPVMDWEFGGSQRRLRHIQFGSLDGSIIRPTRTVDARSVTARAVLCRMTNPHDRESRRLNKQGFPNLNLPAFTKLARAKAIGNGVPFRMGHALATAVSLRSVATAADCPCGCGRRITGKQLMATASCRKRRERERKQPRRRITSRGVTVAAAKSRSPDAHAARSR